MTRFRIYFAPDFAWTRIRLSYVQNSQAPEIRHPGNTAKRAPEIAHRSGPENAAIWVQKSHFIVRQKSHSQETHQARTRKCSDNEGPGNIQRTYTLLKKFSKGVETFGKVVKKISRWKKVSITLEKKIRTGEKSFQSQNNFNLTK
jgi:hypothetical protein